MRLDSVGYPPIEPYRVDSLAVDDLHTIVFEEAGKREGAPILILHGGPGGGVRPYYRQLADPSFYRMVLFDQRGCARSTPFGSLERNTTWDLVADMERLREHLGIEKWVVLGGSWGSTLALAYAQTHPERCAGLIVSGIFLARPQDSAWWWYGVRNVFPEVWEELAAFVPPEERHDLREAYFRRIEHSDPAISVPAARALIRYETQTLTVLPDPERLRGVDEAENTIAMGRLYVHYERNGYFLNENQLIRNASRLRGVPGIILNGRFDACTPPVNAYDLWQAWPQAQLRIIPLAGHTWNEVPTVAALSKAIDEMRRFATVVSR